MEIFAAIIPVAIIGGLIYLFVITLMRAVKLKGSEQIAWVIIIIFLFPFGSIAYLAINPNKKHE